ncbi:MAG: DUF1441 family protein [Halothiobacillaceae bacterium]
MKDQPVSMRTLSELLEIDRDAIRRRLRLAGYQPDAELNGYPAYRFRPELLEAIFSTRPAPACPEAMDPPDRKAWYDAEAKRRALADLDRELIPASEVNAIIRRAVEVVTETLGTLPDRLTAAGLPPEAVRAVEQSLAGELEAFKARLSGLADLEAADG